MEVRHIQLTGYLFMYYTTVLWNTPCSSVK